MQQVMASQYMFSVCAATFHCRNVASKFLLTPLAQLIIQLHASWHKYKFTAFHYSNGINRYKKCLSVFLPEGK
jgi:hypothetical protein